jgi:hypothetical protein
MLSLKYRHNKLNCDKICPEVQEVQEDPASEEGQLPLQRLPDNQWQPPDPCQLKHSLKHSNQEDSYQG